MFKRFFMLILAGPLLAPTLQADVSAAAATLTLQTYLDQVRDKNNTYRGWDMERAAAIEREHRSELVTAPSAFANGRYIRDKKLPTFPVFVYNRLDTGNYAAGVQGATRFGLRARLAYEMDYTDYVGVGDPAFAGIPLKFWDSRPVIELTQSLWQNAKGRSTRAEIDSISYEARAAGYNAEAQLRSVIAQAEAAYWTLVVARSTILVQEDALKSADAINVYTSKRAKMNLSDEADSLQSLALLESRRLELKRATDSQRSALRRFNALRNSAPDEAVEDLESIDVIMSRSMTLPASHRADILAAQAEVELAEANARQQLEGDKPLLEAFGTYALNGRDSGATDSFSDSYSADRPTASAGLRFSVPLAFSALKSARHGTEHQVEAARTRLEQLKADEQSDRIDLTTSLTDAQERLRLSILIASAQKKKLDYERQRLRQGRTSTYQVLLFEQDYSQAELTRVLASQTLLNLLADTRRYSPSDAGNPQ